ncbi:hypothetical protein SLE2022_304510 [Rubroshorea leprosula]
MHVRTLEIMEQEYHHQLGNYLVLETETGSEELVSFLLIKRCLVLKLGAEWPLWLGLEEGTLPFIRIRVAILCFGKSSRAISTLGGILEAAEFGDNGCGSASIRITRTLPDMNMSKNIVRVKARSV